MRDQTFGTEPICPYDKSPISADEDQVVCKQCRAFHHKECWEEYGSCASCKNTTEIPLLEPTPNSTPSKAVVQTPFSITINPPLSVTIHPKKAYGITIAPRERVNEAVADPTLIQIQALKDEDEDVREAAAGALGKIGPGAEKAVPALIQALKDEDRWVREAAAGALGKIGPGAEKAVPALIQALKDYYEELREAAAGALGKIGPKAEKAVPALIQVFKENYENDEDLREAAVKALGKIGPKAEKAIPALTEALDDDDYCVRREAAEAIFKIQQK
jgi:hypothetical protein